MARIPSFGRGATEHDRYYADQSVSPNPSLGPLETAPYYALRCDPVILTPRAACCAMNTPGCCTPPER
ncbi:MAG: hypothetical protein R3E50_00775 [Halioglobus sp.]